MHNKSRVFYFISIDDEDCGTILHPEVFWPREWIVGNVQSICFTLLPSEVVNLMNLYCWVDKEMHITAFLDISGNDEYNNIIIICQCRFKSPPLLTI